MKLATLLYITNDKGEYLLMERFKNPNKGLLSPPGGKLDIENAESPADCAAREAFEECSMITENKDWQLSGIVTEKNYPHIGNIMLFMMKYKGKLSVLPPSSNEGSFSFIAPEQLNNLNLPDTDRLFLWKKILENNPAPFIFTLDCSAYPEIRML